MWNFVAMYTYVISYVSTYVSVWNNIYRIHLLCLPPISRYFCHTKMVDSICFYVCVLETLAFAYIPSLSSTVHKYNKVL